MGLYNFQPRFIQAILAGEKTHTIRAARLRQDNPGDTMHLYTGLRHKGARLLARVECVKVEPISITTFTPLLCEAPQYWVSIHGQCLDRDECEQLARRDGFDSFADMMQFWNGRLPFQGFIFHWLPKSKRSAVSAPAPDPQPTTRALDSAKVEHQRQSGPASATTAKRARSKAKRV